VGTAPAYAFEQPIGEPRTGEQIYPARATIQDDGDWALEDDPVPPQLARCGRYLSILFTGYFERRIRGEMLAYQLDAGQTRRPDATAMTLSASRRTRSQAPWQARGTGGGNRFLQGSSGR
jgi:hypothetical protein